MIGLIVGMGCKSVAPTPDAVEQASHRPEPVLPAEAVFLGDLANVELTITASRDGSIENVTVSRPSRAKLYDEYTRAWVERHWRMAAAQPGDPDARKFIAPIVYASAQRPAGAHTPNPNYPSEYLRKRVEGLVILALDIAPSGKIESAEVVLSSGHKGLDEHTVDWVLKEWKFPPGEPRRYGWPVAYLLR